eukprot:364415-Chlamydomonas_euryale.AAC.7
MARPAISLDGRSYSLVGAMACCAASLLIMTMLLDACNRNRSLIFRLARANLLNWRVRIFQTGACQSCSASEQCGVSLAPKAAGLAELVAECSCCNFTHPTTTLKTAIFRALLQCMGCSNSLLNPELVFKPAAEHGL